MLVEVQTQDKQDANNNEFLVNLRNRLKTSLEKSDEERKDSSELGQNETRNKGRCLSFEGRAVRTVTFWF
ncbi:hypothetical protein BaRGS_00002334 [Batillaria attramentaria]|uniref:Uncharacterized protein n=1 Tax=Batillaria attramentaria TaxID=370345 RepID=A0ABD0M3G8_9CAEN